jgi:phospholipid transport system transporter-binding protein
LAQIQKTATSWKVSGNVTIDDAPSLLTETRHLPAQARLVVDFSEVRHVDTATLSLMFEWLRHAQTKKCDLKFSHLPQNLQSLMALYGITELIPQVKR